MFYRVLRPHHHERIIHPVFHPVIRDLPFLHHFKQSRLCLCRSPVDLVHQHDIRENRSFPIFKTSSCRKKNRGPQNITRHQVRRKLNPVKSNIQHPGHNLCHQRLGNPQQQIGHFLLTDNHLTHPFPYPGDLLV